jgi:hypothetical protein
MRHYQREDAQFCDVECKNEWFRYTRKLTRKYKRIVQLLNELDGLQGIAGFQEAMQSIKTLVDAISQDMMIKDEK